MKKFFIILGLSLLLAFATFGESESESSQILLTGASGSNVDIDGNEQFDALTDGLLVLRSMFGLTGTSLISGSVASDAIYTDATDIESRITGLGNRLDIDDNGNIDALTDGLIVLRYLFGLTGDTLVKGVVAADANRESAAEIEAHMAVLTSLDTEPPVITSSANYTAAENQTTIGTATATDANSASISFSVSGFDLEITSDGVLSFATAPDYETKSTYTAVITATDGTNLTPQDIIVSVSDIDEAPIMGALNYTADENQTSIGSVVATDPEGEAVSFSVSGSELLITSDGVLSFVLAPDYETKSSYTATVTATDGTNSATASVIVNVGDVDDVAPAFSSSATFSMAENQTAIGTVTATDVDTDNSSIAFTVSGSELSITSAGVLNFVAAPDYETKTSYTATVTATDGTNSTTQSITVNVTNLNDNSPVFTSSATFSAAENQTSIGTVTATDGDASDSVTFTVSGSELSITSAGLLTFASAPDYETKTSYTATVTATDGTNSTTQSVTVTVTDVDDVAPAFSSSATFSAAENQTAIGTVTATDVDTDNSAITFTVSGSELSLTSAGVLTFASAPDYETKTSYTATVTATDGTNSTIQSITVNVSDVDDVAPAFSSSATFSAAENQTAIGTVAATDADTSDSSISFTVSGSDLSITSAGVLTFASAPDYETKTSYTATVTATDGTNSATQSITVSVTNLNDNSPVFTSSASLSANENQTTIGTVAASDADGNTLSYSISGTDASSMGINSSSGALMFNSAPDYETKSSYSVTATASDGTNSTTQSITVSVNDLNESPAFTSSASFSAAENQTSIGSVSVSDPESGSISYSLSGTDASSMAISSSGVLTFASAPNYEADNSYSATVTASDGTNAVAQNITVSVTDVNDAPVATSRNYYMHLYPKAQSAVSIALAGTDEDGDSLTYSIVSNGSYGTVSISGTTATYTTSSGTQASSSESFTFKVNDGTTDSSSGTIALDLRTDPLYQYQWHLNNTGQTNFSSNGGTSGHDLNVDAVINVDLDGTGVVVAVVDSGLELAHEDLAANIIASKSWDYVNSDLDPSPSGTTGDHGTSVAGIIGAVGWNKLGGRGVAPDVGLVGYNYMAAQGASNQANALGNGNSLATSAGVDIFNLSYGIGLSSSFGIALNSTVEAALLNGVTNYRGGKGAIYVNSAGNDFYDLVDTNSDGDDDTNYYCGATYASSSSAAAQLMPCWDASFDPMFATPYIIGVGSLQSKSSGYTMSPLSTYSTPGSSIWVSGFGGQFGTSDPAIMTVDQSSCSKGYVRAGNASSNAFNNQGNHSSNTSCNYTSTFNGTSSAAPTVSGVIALMLDANENLTWRDVKHILASTSTKIDASRSKTEGGLTQYAWTSNAANYDFHNWYGFGQINATSAVSAALSYSAGSLGTFVSTYVLNGTNETISCCSTSTSDIVITAPAGSDGIVEFVRIGISLSHGDPEELGIRLLSPSGTLVNLLTPYHRATTNPSYVFFEIGVNAFYGESMAGTWTIALNDYINDGDSGTLSAWDIKVYGH